MRLAVLALLVALPFLASCGGGESASGTATATAPAAGATEITATEFAFDPAEISVDAGAVTLGLVNEGSAPHAIAIEGNGVDESSDTIGGGESTELEVELEEGTYEIYCPVGDHRERGMVGTLTVGGGAADDGGGEDDSAGGGAGY